VGAFSVTKDRASFVVSSLSAIAGLQHGDSGADSEEDFEDSLRRSHAIIPLESMGAQDLSRRQTVASFGAASARVRIRRAHFWLLAFARRTEVALQPLVRPSKELTSET
jgi:hypothetical protein